jgi:hypothetical protein
MVPLGEQKAKVVLAPVSDEARKLIAFYSLRQAALAMRSKGRDWRCWAAARHAGLKSLDDYPKHPL